MNRDKRTRYNDRWHEDRNYKFRGRRQMRHFERDQNRLAA